LIAKPNVNLTVARRAQSGTVLVRDWNGMSHRVMIMEDGFYYDDRTYSNLSEIARLITGTRWNGPLFLDCDAKKATYSPSQRGPIRHRLLASTG